MNMNAIVAADKNWAIGYKNKLLVSIPADMKFFRQMTGGKVVVISIIKKHFFYHSGE